MQTSALKKEKKKTNTVSQSPGAGFIWFLGFIGAFVYYLQQADGFVPGVVAFLKALAWPAFLVYKLLS
jgi:hypothetical protein